MHAAAIAGDSVTVNLAELTSFRPGRPEPLHRYDKTGQPRAEGNRGTSRAGG